MLLLIFLSFAIWKTFKLGECRKKVSASGDQLMFTECSWIENLKLYSLVYTDYFNNRIFFHDKTENKTSILIYRYSKYMCESCIQEDLQEIEFFQKEIGKEKILLLPAYPNNRAGMIELSNVLAKFNYVNIPSDSLLIPLQNGDFLQRYFAIIDRDGNLNMVFFPRNGEKNLTRIYFSEVKKELLTE